MGAPTSSIVVEIFVIAFESVLLTIFDHKPKIWERHVDHIFAVMKKQRVQRFLPHLSNLHKNINFTLETELDATLPFLDSIVKRHPDRNISVNVYRKPTLSIPPKT